ncbi:MAG: rhomboid family intramembrane serine protease, partial [Candidatus Nanohaloarchaea archaeon]
DCDGLREYKDRSREEGTMGYTHRDRKETDVTMATAEQDGAAGDVAGTVKDYLPDGYLPDSATFTVLGVMAAVFILEYTVSGFFEAFALYPGGQVVQEPWRLVTSMFMHAGLAHLMVNGLVLFSFGPHLEDILGTKRFLAVLFGAGLASSAGFAISGLLFGIGPAVGISGGLYGLITFLAIIRPEVTVLAFFFIPLKIRHAVTFFGAMDTVNLVAHAMGITLPLIGGFASAGHLSGLLAGLAFGYLWRDEYRRPTGDVLWQLGATRNRPF